MAEGRPPLMDMHPLRALLQIPKRPPPRLNLNSDWSSKLVSFLELCLVKDPDKRATAQELLNHEFIKSAGKRSIIREYLTKTMPSIETYRKEKNWKTDDGTGTAQFEDTTDNNDNDDIENDNKENNNNDESKSNNTMIVEKPDNNKIGKGKQNETDNNNKNKGNEYNNLISSTTGNYDYGRSLINPNRKPLSELDERSPEYIVRPLFEERTPIFREFVCLLLFQFLFLLCVVF